MQPLNLTRPAHSVPSLSVTELTSPYIISPFILAFLLNRAVVPLIQGYEDSGDFTVTERFKTSVHVNLVFYLLVGFIALIGLLLLITLLRDWNGGVLGFAMACSNTFGLVTGAFLLGFGLSEIPRSLWENAHWTFQQKVLSHKIAKMALKLDEAHHNFSNAIVVAQATSNQMSKCDPLRPYMDVIDKMLAQMFKEDPLFKPQGGRLGENDMDYDADDKSMATLRRQLRVAHKEYYRKYVSSFRGSRPGSVGSILDSIELLWRCILSKQLQRALAIILGCMSVAILLAEATLLPSGVDLSLFSILIKSVGRRELYVQVLAFIPLMYMCICTYYSLFKIGMLMFYSLTPRQTSSVNLLMICSMVARYAPPISYNFLNLIRLDHNAKTIFEERMGNIDDAVPFFGEGFNKIYLLIMVIYTILVASNFFDWVIDYFGSWKRFRFRSEADDTDGFDASGMIILHKERSWLEQGRRVGEQVLPLARNFNNISLDLESGFSNKDDTALEMKGSSSVNGQTGSLSRKVKPEIQKYSGNKEVITSKYSAMREHSRPTSFPKLSENTIDSAKVSLLNTTTSDTGSDPVGLSAGLTSSWQSMKSGFQNLKTNLSSKKFLPLRQSQETKLLSHTSSSESLNDIFHRLEGPTMGNVGYNDDNDNVEISDSGSIR